MPTTLDLYASLPPARRNRLAGAASLTDSLTPTELRVIVFVLSQHEATDTTFREVPVPLTVIFGSAIGDAYQAVSSLFSQRSPVLKISEVDLFGQLVRRGSFCVMPLLSSLSYAESASFVNIILNDYIIEFLPQLLELLRTAVVPADLSACTPAAPLPLALAA